MTPEEQAAADAAARAAAEKSAADQQAADEAARKAAEDAKKTPEQLAAENDAGKWRRLHEKAEKDLADARAELKKRQDAELSETERAKKELEEARAERDTLRQDVLRQRIASEAKLDADLTEFLTAPDEAGMRAQAERLAAKAAPAGTAPVKGGTGTQPVRGQTQSVDEQIAAAEKAGNVGLSIRLKRQQAFGQDE